MNGTKAIKKISASIYSTQKFKHSDWLKMDTRLEPAYQKLENKVSQIYHERAFSHGDFQLKQNAFRQPRINLTFVSTLFSLLGDPQTSLG